MAAVQGQKIDAISTSAEPATVKKDEPTSNGSAGSGGSPEKASDSGPQDNLSGSPRNGPANFDRNQSGFRRGNNKNHSHNNDGGRPRHGSDNTKQDNKQPSGPGPAKPSDKPDEEKKFSTLCRLFVGNLSQDTTEQDVKKIFSKYTEAVPDVYMGKMYAFVRLDTKANADKAKSGVDGSTFKGRILRVRFASSSSGVKVKNLGQNVCNELLQRAFERFGEIDKCVVAVDEKGKPCGEGYVYFSRKPGAMQALHRVNEGIFLLGASPRPVVVELLDEKDVDDGMAEIHISNRQSYQNEITEPPHFAAPGSLEYEFGLRWKKLLEDHQSQLQQIERVFQNECENLEKEMEKSIDDFEINKIKQTIAQETLKMRQLEERKAQRRPGGPMNQPQQQQQQQQMMQGPNMQHNMNMNQQGLQGRNGGQQQMGMPPVPPPGFGLPVGMGQGLRPPGQQFMEPFGLGAGPAMNMLGNFMPNGPMGGPVLRMPGQYGAPNPFEQQQHFDPNISSLGQRQADFKRGNDNRGSDLKRPRN